MKKLFVTLMMVFSLGLLTAISANLEQQADQTVMVDQDEKRKMIEPEDLPEKVKEVLKTDEYTGWAISECWKVKKDGKEFYEIKMSDNIEMRTVRFTEEGIQIE